MFMEAHIVGGWNNCANGAELCVQVLSGVLGVEAIFITHQDGSLPSQCPV